MTTHSRTRLRAGRGLYLTLGLTLASLVSSSLLALPMPLAADDSPVVFEDRAKRLSFRPPTGFYWSAESSAGMLRFDGPKAGSAPASIRLQSWPEGRALADVVAAMPGEMLAFETPPNVSAWEAGAALPGVEHAARWTYTEKRKTRVAGVALMHHGARVVAMICEGSERQFAALADTWQQAASALQLDPLTPAFIDAPTGLTFYELPPGFDVDENRSTSGSSIAWVYAPDGIRAADLLIKIEKPIGDEAAPDGPDGSDGLEAWARDHVKRNEGDGVVVESQVAPFHLSGHRGWLLEALVSYGGNGSTTTRYEVVVQDGKHLFSFACYAETNHFVETMRPTFERFLKSITLGSS